MMTRDAWYLGRSAWELFAVVMLFSTAVPLRLCAQKLEDNSFLVEEAYNQPARVVQHIGTAAAAEGTTGL